MREQAGTIPDPRQDDPVRHLETLEQGTTAQIALAFFDALPPVGLEEMTGSWRGRGVPTGNPLDGMLERLGWRGKRFEGVEDVHPLVFDDGRGERSSVNPALIPMRLVLSWAPLVNTPIVARLVRLVLPLARTRRPAARLRMMEYRGVLTATMIYDALPINDAFRKVDDDTVLGVMDLRGMGQPFVFSLRRE